LQVIKEGRLVRQFSKGGHDWTKRLARLAEALAGIPCKAAVIDTELVFPAADGVPDFAGLQIALGGRQDELAVFAFDLMHRDGADLIALPLAERRRRLERLLAQSEVSCLHVVRSFDDGAALFIAAERHGMRHRFETTSIALQLGAIARLGEDQDRGLASCEPGKVAPV
jgi:bifunctional non-homologous end joining protein LigD